MSGKNVPEQEAQGAPKKKKRPLLLRCLGWFFKGLVLLVVLVLLAAIGGGYWLLQTGSGQEWLVAQANKFLDGGAPNGKMRFHVTHLSGSLPFTIDLGLEALDDKGVFLRAPDNKFVWNWRELPKSVKIEKLNLTDASLLRLPDLPPAPEPKEDEKPLTFDDIRAYIGQGAEFLANPPSWMPTIKIDNVALVNATFPQSLLGTENADDKKSDSEKPDAEKLDAAQGVAASAESVPDAGKMLRADADLALSLDRSGAVINADARLANEAGKKVNVPSFAFETANVGLKVSAKPDKNGLGAHVGLNAVLDEPALGVADMPKDLLGERASLDLALDARAVCPDYGPAEAVEIALAGPALDAGRIQAKGQGGWKSGPGFARGEFDGPVNMNLKFDLANGAPGAKDLLAMLHAPVNIVVDASGEPDKPNLNLAIACADIEASGHSIRDLKLNLGGRELVLPIGEKALESDETKLDLKLSGSLDKHELVCNTGLFYKPQGSNSSDFTAGLRNLDLLAAGVQGRGDVSARMQAGQKPALDGALKLKVVDWDALSALLPGNKLDGDARIDVDLASGRGGQGANVEIEVPRFSMVSGKEQLVGLRGFGGRIGLADVFAKPAVDAKINLENADAAGMHFGAKVAASGPIAGPLEAHVESSGSVAAKVDARWEPGQADIKALDVRMDMPPIGNKQGKPVTLGVRSARPMKITYGDGGIGVGDVDLEITPAGRLAARGGLSPEKLDLDIRLSGVAFKPWQALVSQLPEGGCELTANLKGTPQRPHGNFRFGLVDVKVPQVPLAPITMALAGAIEPSGGNGGILTARLELPQKTVQSLGGTRADVNARLPLTFGQNGIPAPNMKGPLAAHVVWDGALGPLWKLVPVADMRLNGRINMNIEAAGSMEAPRVKGGINIDNGRYENVAVGVLLTAINAKLNLTDAGGAVKGGLPGAMQLAMSASDGRGGSVTVNGGCALTGENLDIEAKINKLRPLRRRDVYVELSGGAKVSGSAAAPVVVGEIIVDKGEFLLDNIAMGASSVTTLPITTPETVKAAAEKAAAEKAAKESGKPDGQGSLNVKINMPPRFSVEGRGLTSLWEAHLLVSGTPVDPAITGNVSCFRGNFDFLGKNFVLTRGTVTFAGGSLANPLLDIELTNETPDLTAHLWITGPVDKMKLSLTSDPSLPQDDILSKVLFGRSSNELSRLEALQLAGAVAQLSGFTGNGSSIFQIGKKALGLDVLRLGSSSADSGEPGETTASGTTLEAGKYINDWIYMGVQQGMKPDSTAFVIELELTPHSNIEVKTDQSNTWGGYKWKYNY